ncbi:MAG: SDR family NAD(P)-dependent oxidoreductase [Bradyrhizobium sp.]|nr:MAG: SDR family NAD(P)-dependent oxidoreductase [Bradyrhizobium sp.]
MTMRKLTRAIVLVTGANRGLGRALADELLERGVKKLYAAARDPRTLAALDDPRVVKLRLDVTDADQVQRAIDAAPDVQIVISNAGLALGTALEGPGVLDQAQREMDVNYFGPLRLLQRIAPTLAKNGGGVFVAVASVAGLTNVPFLPTYAASKAALHSLIQAARVLLAGQGASVVGVYPGPIDTDMSRGLAIPKTAPRDVAIAILDGVEAGREDIFPDPFALDFGRAFEASPKDSERRVAAMMAGAAA